MRKFRITIGDETFEVAVEEVKERRTAPAPAASVAALAALRPAAAPRVAAAGVPAPPVAGAVYAASPCTVTSIKVTGGAVVNAGDTLLITESMKMQTAITAKSPGTVKAIHVQQGQFVKRGAPLISIE